MEVRGQNENRPLRVLLIEDSEADTLLIVRELRRGGFEPSWRRVDTARGLAEALDETWDLITCDWKMPGFEAPEALAQLAAAGIDVPIILVSGEVGEEFAVTAMRAGAHDFVSKERLARLAPAVERELREAAGRRARKQAEADLRATQDRYRALIERASDQVAVVDLQGIYRYVSPSHFESCGFTPEELTGTRAFDLVHPDDLPRVLDHLATTVQTGESGGVAELRFRHKNGGWRFVEIAAQNLLEDPLVRGILINARDVTARREMEETLWRQQAALEQEREFLATLIRSLPDMIWMKDPDGVYLTCNPAFERFIGRAQADIVGRTDADLIPVPELVALFRAKDAEAIARGGPGRNEEWVTLAGDQRRVLLETIKTPIRNAAGTLLGVLGVSRDITEMRAAQDSLRQRVALQAELEEIAGTAPGVICSFHTRLDGTTTCRYASPGLRDIYDLDHDDVRDDISPLLSMVHPDDVAHVGESIGQAARTMSPWRDTFRIRNPRRGEVWIEARSTPRLEADGSIQWHGVIVDVTEQQRAMEQARRWTRVFEEAHFGVAYANAADNTFIEVNPAFAREHGYSAEELVGQPVTIIYPPEEIEAARTRLPLIDQRGHLIYEVVHLRKDGTRYPVLMEVTAIRDSAGKVVSRVAFAVDISERRATQSALRESDSRYRALFRNMLDGCALCRLLYEDGEPADFVYLDVNSAFETLTGLHDVVGRRVSEVIPGLHQTNPEILAAYARVVATGEPATFETHLPTLGIWLRVSAYATGHDTFVAVFDNLTEGKQAQAQTALQTSALQAAANAIVITDRAGTIVWTNPAFTRLTGYTVDDAIGRNPRILKSGVQDDEFYAGIWRTITSGRVWSGELVNRRKDGALYAEEMTITPVRSRDGDISHFVAVKQDVTERRRAHAEIQQLNAQLEERVAQRTAELEAANRELEAFTYSVSHDLRAPLRSIEGFSRAAVEDFGARLPDEGRHFLDRIHAGAVHMGELLEALLNLSRLGRVPLATEPLETEALVRSALAELQPLFAGRRVELDIGDLPVCEADRTLLRQVWLNLLSNALKYTARRDPARIEVGSLRRDGEVVYFVRDNGAGFDMRHAGRLFGVFQRLHSAKEFEGTGAGLALVQRIVRRHGGQIWAEAAVDRGATFCFTLG